MSDEDLKSHVEDILNALSDEKSSDVTKDELEEELKKFMEYGVPIDQAKQTLIKKFGGSVKFNSMPVSSERMLIADLGSNERSVNLLAHVISINPKEITVKGEKRNIFYGILGDESGTIPFTAWNDVELKRGDVVEVSNAYTRDWRGDPQLNFGDRVTIKKTGKDRLPSSAFKPREFKVKDLKSGLGSVEVTARVTELNERETEVNGEKKKVFSGIIADETGKAQFTSWHDFKIKEGDALKISGGYVKTWKGIPQLTFDEKATVKKLEKSKILKEQPGMNKIPLFELVEKRGALDVEVEGTIIEIRPGSGFIMRCPECNRALKNSECSIHGNVEGVPDLRIKIVVDDGLGNVNGVLNRELTEKLLGKTLEECRKMKEDDLLDEMNNLLFTKRIILRGNALGDEFGTTFVPKDAELVDIDIKAEAEKLSEGLEGFQ